VRLSLRLRKAFSCGDAVLSSVTYRFGLVLVRTVGQELPGALLLSHLPGVALWSLALA